LIKDNFIDIPSGMQINDKNNVVVKIIIN